MICKLLGTTTSTTTTVNLSLFLSTPTTPHITLWVKVIGSWFWYCDGLQKHLLDGNLAGHLAGRVFTTPRPGLIPEPVAPRWELRNCQTVFYVEFFLAIWWNPWPLRVIMWQSIWMSILCVTMTIPGRASPLVRSSWTGSLKVIKPLTYLLKKIILWITFYIICDIR